MKIGLIGENPSDTSAIRVILQNYCTEAHQYEVLLKRVKGSMWDSPKYLNDLSVEYNEKKPNITVLMRDLDGFENDRKQKRERNAFLNKANISVNHTGVKLLHIWELEALLFSDTVNLNKHYKTNIPKPADPMAIKDPKGVLMEHTAQCTKPYREGHVAEVCEKLDPATLIANCRYFAHFIREIRNKGVK
jgi:hypothetical protein